MVEVGYNHPDKTEVRPMAEKRSKRKSNLEGKSGAGVLDRLESAEAASVLKMLLERHSELRSEAEAIARGLLTEISPFSVADDVENAVLQFDYDDLNSRAGSHSWGYVEPSEAAQELLDEAVEPFVSDMKRYLEMKLEAPARQFCHGIVLGLYRVRDSGNDILGWAPDFPGETAANVLEVWSERGAAEGGGAPAKKRGRRLSAAFVREHMSDWGGLLKPRR
jgi:hypothetical protein